jgi:hypothetical protein
MGRSFASALLGALAWACVGLSGCAKDPGNLALNEEIAKLRRDTTALIEALESAKAGDFIRPQTVLIGVHERAVEALMGVALPIEQTVPSSIAIADAGVRIERAKVSFDGGYGTLSVEGRAWLVHRPSVAATIRLSGGFEEIRIAPERRVVEAKVSLDTLDVRPLPGGLLARVFQGALLRVLNAGARSRISEGLPPLEIPIRLDYQLRIPDTDEDPVHFAGATLPVTVTFVRAFATRERLWIALEPKLGPWQREKEGR